MTTDQLTPEQKATASPFLGDNRGWGFGMSIVTARTDLAAVPGRFGWDGGYGTSWRRLILDRNLFASVRTSSTRSRLSC